MSNMRKRIENIMYFYAFELIEIFDSFQKVARIYQKIPNGLHPQGLPISIIFAQENFVREASIECCDLFLKVFFFCVNLHLRPKIFGLIDRFKENGMH